MNKNLLVLALCGALAACSEPTLDGSSDAAFKASMEKVVAGMPAEEAAQLREDVTMLAMQSLDFGAIMAGAQTDVAGDMRAQLDGKTADQVMAQATKVRAQRAQREREQALAEIQELIAKQAKAEEAAQQLAQFTVTRSRFYKQPRDYGRPEPIIELDVTNGTSAAISRAYFRGTIASPGRQVPWLSDTFNYSISGGLEPGESTSWALAPNAYSDWGTVSAPEDAIFTVEPYKLDGPDGETIYDASGLSEYEQTRLAKLQAEFTR
ncbi:DUF6694 family lipoprotein [Pseudomonas neustonica]|uniref:DUF6694 family lipoprotein n=1 Tax=Pseudomonas neustonica TaxID=2487346 RepID=UPI003F47B5E8